MRLFMTFRDLISETDYAEQRGVSVRSVQRERAQRIGPPFIKVGRKVYYRPAAIEAWLLAKEQIQPRAKGARS
ncbi:helix-turn-helix domain-containing protein [Aliiroseovarius salicola]|uniref:helix-turn-helix domain-containing protein n=1 Tax=Aliiroseovarius salicola TaxID=3009082 RepID=UPI002FDE445C